MLGLASRAESLARWGKKIALVGGAQAAVQLMGFLAGVLVIRQLAPDQYALYTIANTALGAMTVLSDSGICNGVLSEGGKVWSDRVKLGSALATGLELRRRFSIVAAVVSLPFTAVLLQHQGASWLLSIVVALSILPLFFLSLTSQLLEIVPRLHQNLLPLQRVQVLANFGRVLVLGLVLPLWPLAAVASMVAALPQSWSNWRLRRIATEHADWHVASDPQVKSHLLTQVRRVLPGSIYYSVSGQLTIWLIAIFGQTASIAAVGALGRLAMILGVLGSIFTAFVIPRFARIPREESSLVARRYWQSQVALAAGCMVPMIALAMFPGPVLAILGPSYRGLEVEALLMAGSTGASLLTAAAFGLAAARGIVAPPGRAIAYCVLVQALLIYSLPLDTISGVIWLGLLSALSQWLLHVVYFIYTQSAHKDLTRLS